MLLFYHVWNYNTMHNVADGKVLGIKSFTEFSSALMFWTLGYFQNISVFKLSTYTEDWRLTCERLTTWSHHQCLFIPPWKNRQHRTSRCNKSTHTFAYIDRLIVWHRSFLSVNMAKLAQCTSNSISTCMLNVSTTIVNICNQKIVGSSSIDSLLKNCC